MCMFMMSSLISSVSASVDDRTTSDPSTGGRRCDYLRDIAARISSVGSRRAPIPEICTGRDAETRGKETF